MATTGERHGGERGGIELHCKHSRVIPQPSRWVRHYLVVELLVWSGVSAMDAPPSPRYVRSCRLWLYCTVATLVSPSERPAFRNSPPSKYLHASCYAYNIGVTGQHSCDHHQIRLQWLTAPVALTGRPALSGYAVGSSTRHPSAQDGCDTVANSHPVRFVANKTLERRARTFRVAAGGTEPVSANRHSAKEIRKTT